jgi:hypothetical protein
MSATLLKLGKKPATYDKRDLQYIHYRIPTQLPAHGKVIGHQNMISAWDMLGNGPDPTVSPDFEGAGNCVFAGSDHETMLWTMEGANPASFTGLNALSDYSAVTGYVIGDESTDQGTNTRDALNYRRQNGLIDSAGLRHKIAAYVALELGNLDNLYEALYLFSAVGLGIQVPDSAQAQFGAGSPWSVVHGATIVGGHYVPIVGFDGTDLIVVTWGQLQRMTLQFYKKYADEAYGILSPEMLKTGKTLDGFDLASLQVDLEAVA